jgi:acylphosphatase
VARPRPVARRVVVHGRVQGVWFRDTTQREAQRHGVAGWVRNVDDGTVEALFEGEPAGVEALVRFVHDGPPKARVEQVVVEDARPEGLQGFEVR